MNPKTNKLVISRDVIFDELAAWQWEENVQESKNLEVAISLDFQDKSNSLLSMNFEEAQEQHHLQLDLQALPCQIQNLMIQTTFEESFAHCQMYINLVNLHYLLVSHKPLKMLQRRMCRQKRWMKKLLALREITHGSLWTCQMEET